MLTRRTPWEIAILLHGMLLHSGLKRARVSKKTVEFLSSRTRLIPSFELQLRDDLASMGWGLHTLGTGVYGLIRIRALEGAKTLTLKGAFSARELQDLKEGTFNVDAWAREMTDIDPDDDDDESFT